MRFLNFSEEFRSLPKRIIQIANAYDMRELADAGGNLPFPAKDDSKADMALLIEITNNLEGMVEVKSTVIVLNDSERLASLKESIVRIAAELHGGQAFMPESLKKRIEQVCDAGHRESWELESPGVVVTLINQIKDVLKAEGVLAWSETEHDPGDPFVRIVRVDWLTDEADIFSHVSNPAPAGKACRYCLAGEKPASLALQPVDPERSSIDVTIAGMTGRKMQIMQPGVVYCHRVCSGLWLEWVRIAEALDEAAT